MQRLSTSGLSAVFLVPACAIVVGGAEPNAEPNNARPGVPSRLGSRRPGRPFERSSLPHEASQLASWCATRDGRPFPKIGTSGETFWAFTSGPTPAATGSRAARRSGRRTSPATVPGHDPRVERDALGRARRTTSSRPARAKTPTFCGRCGGTFRPLGKAVAAGRGEPGDARLILANHGPVLCPSLRVRKPSEDHSGE
jgi:hypothetical protein